MCVSVSMWVKQSQQEKIDSKGAAMLGITVGRKLLFYQHIKSMSEKAG